MRRFDATYGRLGKVLAELRIYEDTAITRLSENGFVQEMKDAADDLLASLRFVYGECELIHSRIIDEFSRDN